MAKENKRKPKTPKSARAKQKPAEAATAVATDGVAKKKKKVRVPKAPKGKAAQSPAGKGKGDKDASDKWKHGDWACAKCGAHNFRGKDTCFRCKYPKANSVKAASAETAQQYLQSFTTKMDSVQHLWLAKNVYGRDVNDACFDLFASYVRKVDNKSKLQLLTGAQKAVERASKIVEALKDTPTEVEENGDTPKKAKGLKRKGEEKGVKKAEKEKPKKKSKVEKAEDKPKDDKKAAKKEKKEKKEKK